MKTLIYILAFVFGIQMQAQQHNKLQKLERIKTAKVSFISSEINLSSKQAEKFWPIYHKHNDIIMSKRQGDFKRILPYEVKQMTEEEAQKKLNHFLETEATIAKHKRLLFQELEGVIDYKQMVLLQIAEANFKRRLLNQLKRRPPRN